ncbi:MAG: peptide ABC transporter substrate-binding protein [Gammaproteobacteria bacterium]|jgi:oligopeptide transport system substrate-binding protein|nr:peptide ABC transporter substrate-binding protein [Gammaproteobacteria bacterium]
MSSLRYLPLLVLLSLATISGCTDRSAVTANTLQRAIPTDPETLDQHKARTTQAADILRDVSEGLVSYSPDGELVPAATTSWDLADDGLTYTFHLREDAKWSNGDPVIAEHFVAGVERLIDPETAAFYAEFLSDVSNIEAADDLTLVLTLRRPTPYLLSLLTHPATFPIHTPSLAEHGDGFARPGKFVSNGAYVLDAWVPGSVVSLRRNEHYWNNAATSIDKVNYHILVQDSSELNRYRTGELQITSTVPPDNFAQVQAELADELHVSTYLGVYYYGFNLSRPPFKDNPELRQALSMAIDREQLTTKVTGRGEAPAYSWVPPGANNYEPPALSYSGMTQAERNRVARNLYKAAGYGEDNPLQIELRYNTSDTQRRVAVAIQSMWKETLGVETTLVNEEFQVLLANIRQGDITQVFRSSWIGDYDDAHAFLKILESDNPANSPGYESEEFDSLMQRAAIQTDLDSRRLYLEEAERVMLADHPAIPIYFYVSKHLVSPEIEGWGDNVLDYHYSQHLSFKAAQ